MPLDKQIRKEVISDIGFTLLNLLSRQYDIVLIGVSDDSRFCVGCRDSEIGKDNPDSQVTRKCLAKPCVAVFVGYQDNNGTGPYPNPQKNNKTIIDNAAKYLGDKHGVEVKADITTLNGLDMTEAKNRLLGSYKDFNIFTYEAGKA